MSYLTYALLTEDVDFGRRSRSCIMEQANVDYDNERADVAALARSLLKQEAAQTVAMLQGICAGPNFDVEVDNGDGTIDSSKVSDEEMLTQCKLMVPKVAVLFYNPDGSLVTT